MTGLQTSRRRGLLFGAAGALLVGDLGKASGTELKPGIVKRLYPDPAVLDHGKLIQAAIREVEQGGGGCIELGFGTYKCPTAPIFIDPTKTSLVGDRATLDFSGSSRIAGTTNGSPPYVLISFATSFARRDSSDSRA